MIEGLEGRCLMATALPDIAMISATTGDSKSVSFGYQIANAAVTQPLEFQVYRSDAPTLDAGSVAIGSETVVPTGEQGGLTLDAAGQSATAVGTHALTVPISGGVSIDPSHPYVVVVADPKNNIVESNEANNIASFRVYTLGVISHGGLQPKSWYKTGPPWERKMADEMLADGYDNVIPFNWASISNMPGSAAKAAPRLEQLILQAARQFPANSVVDLHFIGHSEGAVVNSQALIRLDQDGLPPNLQDGFIQMTMLDPHAAEEQRREKARSIALPKAPSG